MGRNRTEAVNEYSSIKLRLNTLIGHKKRELVELNRMLVWSSNGKQIGSIPYDLYLIPESNYVRYSDSVIYRPLKLFLVKEREK